MFDFEAAWFKRFSPPDFVNDEKYAMLDDESPTENLIEMRFSRNEFLESFTLNDETEVEFQMKLLGTDAEGTKLGRLQLIKTREWFLVEAHIPFELTAPGNIKFAEIYTFPNRGLLCSLAKDNIKGLKSVFSTKTKQEVLKLDFD
jgi:hypothetical protein